MITKELTGNKVEKGLARNVLEVNLIVPSAAHELLEHMSLTTGLHVTVGLHVESTLDLCIGPGNKLLGVLVGTKSPGSLALLGGTDTR